MSISAALSGLLDSHHFFMGGRVAERKLLGPCPICGRPVYDDQDPDFEHEREIGERDVPAHTACAEAESDAILDEMRRRLGLPPVE